MNVCFTKSCSVFKGEIKIDNLYNPYEIKKSRNKNKVII